MSYYYRAYAAKSWQWHDWWGQFCRLSEIEDGEKYEIFFAEGENEQINYQTLSIVVNKRKITISEADPKKLGERDYLSIIVYDEGGKLDTVYNQFFERKVYAK